MFQPGFYGSDKWLNKIDKQGDPSAQIDKVINREIFRPVLEKVQQKVRKFTAGTEKSNIIALFNVSATQLLCSLFDVATEFQILTGFLLDASSFRIYAARSPMSQPAGVFARIIVVRM